MIEDSTGLKVLTLMTMPDDMTQRFNTAFDEIDAVLPNEFCWEDSTRKDYSYSSFAYTWYFRSGEKVREWTRYFGQIADQMPRAMDRLPKCMSISCIRESKSITNNEFHIAVSTRSRRRWSLKQFRRCFQRLLTSSGLMCVLNSLPFLLYGRQYPYSSSTPIQRLLRKFAHLQTPCRSIQLHLLIPSPASWSTSGW